MLNTKYERVIDIINKILENKVARLDDITTKIECDSAKCFYVQLLMLLGANHL